MIKINIGCFNYPVDGWINIDKTPHALIAKYPIIINILYRIGILTKERYEEHKAGEFKNVKWCNVTKGLPYQDNFADFIYSSHMIEHLYYEEAAEFLKECRRVLKDGGILRIVCPDMFKIAKNYAGNLKETGNDNNQIVQQDAKKSDPDISIKFARSFYEMEKRRALKYGHRWMYDFLSLKSALLKSGFREVSEKEFKTGVTPDLEKSEIRSEDSLYVEAKK